MPGLLEESPSPPPANSRKLPAGYTRLANGVILDQDGKPCRSCTSSAAWMSMMKQSTAKKSSSTSTSTTMAALFPGLAATDISSPSTSSTTTTSTPPDCPPDVEDLGRSTWTLLHALTATYPETPTAQQRSNTSQFLTLFSQMYPCWVCAEDFRDWMTSAGNEPRLSNQEEFGRWMCRAHNAVNIKLGKKEFDCDLWRERWKDGWKDGRCG